MTQRPSWCRSCVTSSVRRDPTIAPCQTKRAISKWTSSCETQYSVANRPNYMGSSKVSFISPFQCMGSSRKQYANMALRHCDDAGCIGLVTHTSTNIIQKTTRRQGYGVFAIWWLKPVKTTVITVPAIVGFCQVAKPIFAYWLKLA